jgi:glycosyltransferase involved in cell wall biosynthesis
MTQPDLKLYNFIRSKQPLISVYTPTYKRNDLLCERALKSVLNQTYEKFEYIIVSDGLNPELKEILDSYNDPRIRFFQIERQLEGHNYDNEKQWFIGGCYPANYALDQVKGDWIARIDDDDIWTADHLELSLKYVIDNDLEFITSMYIIEKGGQSEIHNNPLLQTFLKLNLPNKTNPLLGCHSSWFYSAKYKRFRYDPNCHLKEYNRVNDTDLLERLYTNNNLRIGFLKRILTIYKVRPNEIEIGLKAVKEKIKKKEEKKNELFIL